MKTIAIANQKGGVGKTSTTHALAAGLVRRGFKVLAVDLDAQCNLTGTLKAKQARSSSLEVLAGEADMEDAIVKAELCDILPAKKSNAAADTVLKEISKAEYQLRKALRAVQGRYDFCVIDTPPALGMLTVNAFAAADEIIIPTKAEKYSLEGVAEVLESISTVKKYCNPALKVAGILITQFPTNNAIIGKDLATTLEQSAPALGTIVYKTRIRESTPIKETQAVEKDIFSYSPRSNAAKDYNAFINEFLEGDK